MCVERRGHNFHSSRVQTLTLWPFKTVKTAFTQSELTASCNFYITSLLHVILGENMLYSSTARLFVLKDTVKPLSGGSEKTRCSLLGL